MIWSFVNLQHFYCTCIIFVKLIQKSRNVFSLICTLQPLIPFWGHRVYCRHNCLHSLKHTAVTVDYYEGHVWLQSFPSFSLWMQVPHECSLTDGEVDCKQSDLFWWRTTQCKLIDMERELRAGAASPANTFLWCWPNELRSLPCCIWYGWIMVKSLKVSSCRQLQTPTLHALLPAPRTFHAAPSLAFLQFLFQMIFMNFLCLHSD